MDRAHADEMRRRTQAAAVAVVDLVGHFGRGPARWVIIDQVVRCATSIGANYRAARRARSRREFLSKLCVVIEEADETL